MNDYPKWLARIRYKKNWEFEFMTPTLLVIVIHVPDAYKGYPTSVNTEWEISPDLDEEGFRLKVLECIMKLELHESMEFFKWDKKSLYTPDHIAAPWKVPEGIVLQ